MTVNECVKENRDYELFAIGSRTGFMTVAKKEDIKSALEEANDYHFKRFKHLMKEYGNLIDTFDERMAFKIESRDKAQIKYEMFENLKNSGDFTHEDEVKMLKAEAYVKELNKQIINLEKRHAVALRMIPIFEKYLKEWKNIGERRVSKMYKSDITPGQLIIITPGIENGRFWDYEEVTKYKQEH